MGLYRHYRYYPNPFNPSTAIKYSIAAKSFVSLKIFDITGREILNAVNEIKDPGEYELTFSSSPLNPPSGIYFYVLKTGGFTETKKMVLLK